MKAELQKKLMERYPKIFRQKNLPMTQTCMCWGIECPDSWYTILDCLCWKIQDCVDNPPKSFINGKWVGDEVKQVEAVQVKEKFGTLRFYTNSGNKVIEELISMAEALTSCTCAKCGSNDNVKCTGGWVTYLCEKCMKESGCIPWEEVEKNKDYKCTICGKNSVDAENGYDTCGECLNKM